jgi:hypothetical protein
LEGNDPHENNRHRQVSGGFGWRDSAQALLLALMANVFAKFGSSIVMSGVTRLYLLNQGWDQEQMRELFALQFTDPRFMLIGLVPEALGGLAAGYVAARAAGRLEYWHALAAVAVSMTVTFAPVIARVPWLYLLPALGVSVAAALLGGHMRKAWQW